MVATRFCWGVFVGLFFGFFKLWNQGVCLVWNRERRTGIFQQFQNAARGTLTQNRKSKNLPKMGALLRWLLIACLALQQQIIWFSLTSEPTWSNLCGRISGCWTVSQIIEWLVYILFQYQASIWGGTLGKSCSAKSRFLYFSVCTCYLLLLKWVRARLTSRLEPGWLFLFSVFFFQSLFMTANDRTKKPPTHNTSYFNPWQPFKESLILNSECNVCNAASPVRWHGWMTLFTVYFLY